MQAAVKWNLMVLAALCAAPAAAEPAETEHDTVVRNALIYDGSGQPPVSGDVAIDGDRITYVGPHAPGKGRSEVDAHGRAVAPGFINMLAHPEESLLIDGRALSDLKQGVTLEVMGEDSMGPLTPAMKKDLTSHQGDIHYDVNWTTLGSISRNCSSEALRPMLLRLSAPARYALTCWARTMFSRPRRSCSRCVHWSARRWSRARSV